MSEGGQFVETFRRLSLRGSRAAATRPEGTGTERTRRSSTPIVNPFDRRPSQSGIPQASPAKSDVTMEDVSGDFGPIMNAPALPKPPRYKGSSMQERRDLLRAYHTYFAALRAFQTEHNRPFVQPVGSCIEQGTKELIARFTFAKDWQDVTEDEWVEYFLQSKQTAFEDYAALDADMQKLSMDTKLAEAESRVNWLQANLYKILENHNMVDIMFEREQKKLVKYLVAALAPASFKSEVQRRIDQEQNKKYKSNVIEFSRWLTSLLASLMVCEKPLLQQSSNTRPQHHASTQRGHTVPGSAAAAPFKTPPQRLELTAKLESATGTQASKKLFRWPCLKCQSREHRVRDCPQVQPGEVKRLFDEFYAARQREPKESKPPPAAMKRLATADDRKDGSDAATEHAERKGVGHHGTVDATVLGLTVKASLLDSGADASSVSRGFVSELHKQGCYVPLIKRETPQEFEPFGPGTVKLYEQANFDKVVLHTSAGPLVLLNLECWIDESDLTMSLTVGRSVMVALGYSTDGLLVSALEKQLEYVLPTGNNVSESPLMRAQQLREIACFEDKGHDESTSTAPDPDERFESRAFLPETKNAEKNAELVRERLLRAIDDAHSRGLQEHALDMLKPSLEQHKAEFCVVFGLNPPVDVHPLRVQLQPHAIPVRCSARRYAPMERAFMDAHLAELEDLRLVYRNYNSRWASAPRIVPKPPPADFRMRIDSRPVSELTIGMQWPMPQLDVVITHVAGAKVFCVCDWFRGYWQLPLHPDSQEIFTFMTHRGMYTPTRVPMGAKDAVAYCQSVVELIFGDLLYHGVLVWLDDILGYAESEEELMELLEAVLQRCAEYGLKLNPAMCQFFVTEVTWCGKFISAAGVAHSPERVQGLVDMVSPSTASELQQFVCAVNWMRSSIPEFARVTAPLYDILEKAMQVSGARTKRKLAKISLASVGWGGGEEESLAQVKSKLLGMVPLAHPKPDWDVVLVADASLDHWGSVLTQLPPEDANKPLAEQRHQHLAFLSGHFRGSSHRWPTIEKEAFALDESCKRLEYLLMRPRGFRLYTDHRNLMYIFNPYGFDSNMQRYQADKLQRWAMTLTCFQYEIEHIRGEDNAWGDFLSRWGGAFGVCTFGTVASTGYHRSGFSSTKCRV